MFRSRTVTCLVVLSALAFLALVMPLCLGFFPSFPGFAITPTNVSFYLRHNLISLLRLFHGRHSEQHPENLLVRHPFRNNTSDIRASPTSLAYVLPSPSTLLRKSTNDPPSTTSVPLDTSPTNEPKQPPELSTTLLIVLTGGSLLAFTLLAVAFYCCGRCRRRKNARTSVMREKGSAIPRGRRDLENGRALGTSTGTGTGTGTRNGVASPCMFEFSPPSPTWRPTLPSMAYVSSNAFPNPNGVGTGIASGRGQILSAETIMQEREPGRRKVFGGGGWSHGPPVSSTSTPATTTTMIGHPIPRGPPRQTHQPQSKPKPQHPYAQAQPFQGKVGIGMPVAPPVPSRAPTIYRPPAYHRPSRILRGPPPAATATSQTNFASNPAPGAVPTKVARADSKGKRDEASKRRSDRVGATTAIVSIPRIEVHLAQDAPQPDQSNQSTGRRHQGDGSKRAGAVNNAAETGLQRNNSTSSRRSGLGISTINLGRGVLNPCLPPSPTPSDDDVRLAYTVSVISVEPESGMDLDEGGSVNRERTRREESVTKTSTVVDNTRMTSSRDKRKSRLLTANGNKPRTEASVPSSDTKARNSTIPSHTRTTSLKRSDTAKRQALGVGSVDQTTKSELHAMRSLGSESFDSLIAYLEESVEPEEDDARNRRLEREQQETISKINVPRGKAVPEPTGRITRQETARVDERAYEEWVGSLDASPSVLRLAHVDVGSDPAAASRYSVSARAGRRSRSASESAARSNLRAVKMEFEFETEKGKETDPRVPLRERDRNVESRKSHARNKSVAGTDAARNTVQGKVGMHVRALRARSASLKVKNQVQDSATESAGGTVSGGLSITAVSRSVRREETPQEQTGLDQRQQRLGHQRESTLHLSTRTRGKEELSSLPSFSVPSTATQLFATFPSSEASSSASLSASLSNASGQGPSQHGASAASRQTPRTPATSKATPFLTASSGSALTSSSKAISSAAYIARCAPTPHFKSAAVMSFLSPSPPSPSPSRGRLPELPRASRLSNDSMSSVESAESAASAWGRRSEWGRESLTPRFDHLRAVLEGRFEDAPPLPPLETRTVSAKERL